MVELPTDPTYFQIYDTVKHLFTMVTTSDVVVCAWTSSSNALIDSIFEQLSNHCWVVVAAGNNSGLIENYSPARVPTVITVGCLNKSGNKASLSNFSDTKQLEWVPGTNYSVDGEMHSGTSVSAALYSAFLAEAIIHHDHSVIEKLNEQQKQLVKAELQQI